MTKPATIKDQTSSGGVICRQSETGIEIALVSLREGSIWCLPKGVIDKNEDDRSTALREVKEETGLIGEIIDEIGAISYWFFIKSKNIKLHKTVKFFLMIYKGGSTDNHDMEVDEARWFPIEKVVDTLTYRREKMILLKAKKMIEEKGLNAQRPAHRN